MLINVSNLKFDIAREPDETDLRRAAARMLKIRPADISDMVIRKRSTDARHKDSIRYVYSVECDTGHALSDAAIRKLRNVTPSARKVYSLPDRRYTGRPVITGAGPAGLFCAYVCTECGLKPLIIERGKRIDERRADVEHFWKTGLLDPESNVQFGEGGAGTFSDGKLNTLVNDKKGRCEYVLETFVRFGAPADILYDSKPHIGTDILGSVIARMRDYLTEHGAEFMFETRLKDISVSGGRVNGIVIENSAGTSEIETDCVVLAVGHSARDTFAMLHDRGVSMSPKSFAVGFRVEHPRRFIDVTQYGETGADLLPAATYKLTASSANRGVYSFCMCPGGYVVNASSEPGMLAVNGMSYSGRSGANSNSAIIVTVTPDDYPSADVLAGVEFQRELERRAYETGSGAIPVQKFGDFVKSCGVRVNAPDGISDGRILSGWPDDGFGPSPKGRYLETDITGILPADLNRCIIDGMTEFDKKIPGFAHIGAYLSGVESRTSSPVRIERDDAGESHTVRGLYPCGEGAGYAGGITSAAMDGIYIAECVLGRKP